MRPMIKLMKRGCVTACAVMALAFFAGATAPAAQAQIIKPGGVPIPSFFFPAGERRAREACAQELPTCRAAVRAQMEYEMAISLTIPWIILAVGVISVLMWLRAQEKKKAQARLLARAHHNPGAFRKLDREAKEKSNDDEDAEDLN